MAEKVLKENDNLKASNAALQKELDQLKKQTVGSTGESWNAFKNLMPGSRRSIVKKNKIKEGKKEVQELMAAAKAGDSAKVERAIENGVPVDSVATWEFGETALMVAAKWGHTHTVELLIANRADIDVRDENGETALLKASEWGRTETVVALLHRGARIDIPAKRTKMTALMTAAKLGHTDTAVALIKEGANFKVLNTMGQNHLQCARMNGHDDTADAMEKACENRRKSKKIDPTNL